MLRSQDDTDSSARAVMSGPSAAGDKKGRSEVATARPSAAGDKKGRSEAATARPSAAGDKEGRSEAATARPSAARGKIQATTALNDQDLDMQNEIMECAAAYFLDGVAPPRETLRITIAEAVEAASTHYEIAEANEWANVFEFPQDVLDSDLRCFRAAQLDFETMVRRRLRSLRKSRL